MPTRNQNHLTSSEIVTFLDGECTSRERKRIQRHLGECWKCRATASEVERGVNGLVESLGNSAWPSEEHQELALRRLTARIHREHTPYASSQSPRPLKSMGGIASTLSQRWFTTSAAVVGVLALVWFGAAYSGLFEGVHEVPPVAHAARTAMALHLESWELPERLRRAENEVWSGAYPITILRAKGGSPQRAGTKKAIRNVILESRNDDAAGDYRLRWREPSGRIHLASWQPDRDPRFAYVYRDRRWDRSLEVNRGSHGAILRGVDQLETTALNDETIDEAVFSWVRSLAFNKHLITQRFADLAALPGSRTTTQWHDSKAWTCVAMQPTSWELLDCLRLDGVSGTVMMERIYLRQAEHELEIQIEWAPAKSISRAVFREEDFLPPGLRALDSLRIRSDRKKESIDEQIVEQQSLLSAAVDADEVLVALSTTRAADIEVRLSIEEERVTVSGRVNDNGQLAELDSLFRAAVDPRFLQVELATAEEAEAPPDGLRMTGGQDGPAEPLAAELIRRRRAGISLNELSEYCNRTLQLSIGVLSTARQLSSLAARYPVSSTEMMLPEDRLRLHRIHEQRHLQLRLAVGDLQQHLEALGVTASLPGVLGAHSESIAVSDHSAAPGLLASAKALHKEVLRQFALGQHGEGETRSPSLEGVSDRIQQLLRHEAISQSQLLHIRTASRQTN